MPAPDPLAPVRTELEAIARGIDAPEMGAFRSMVWSAIAHALAASVREGFFDRWPAAVRVFQPLNASASDQQLFEWNLALNPDETADLRYFFQVDAEATDLDAHGEVGDDEAPPTLHALLAALGQPISTPEFLRVAQPFAGELVDEQYDDGDRYISAPRDGIAFLFQGETLRAVFLYARPAAEFHAYRGFNALIDGLTVAPTQGEARERFGEPRAIVGNAQLFVVDGRFMTIETQGASTSLVTLMLENPIP